MRVSPISVCYGTKLKPQSRVVNSESAAQSIISTNNQNVQFRGLAGKILGGLAGAMVGTAAAAITGGALIPYFLVAGAVWGDKEEEDAKNKK